MTNMEQQFSEEDLMITQSSKSVRDPIPVDLHISRVSANSIARFRCVSKFWESLLGRQDFTELFLTKSVARPRLFSAVEVNEELLVFSSPQPQDPDETSSLVATPYKAFPKCFPTTYCTPLYGLVFLQNWKRNVWVICNPVTGESITLPKLAATGHGERHFGFDSISKQFKVLCNAWSSYATPNSHRFLTLETREPPTIPVDLLIEIFSKVPAKSIARFRCVSKFWESILCRQEYFTELFLTNSLARPRLFFALQVNKKLFVFSSPQPQNPDETSSLVTTPYKAFPKRFPSADCTPLYGLVLFQNRERDVGMICNPVTGESIILPKVKAWGCGQRYFGFDPMNKQFKVLCVTSSSFLRFSKPNSHRVLTLESGKCLWRRIQDPLLPTHYYPGSGGICINGVVYYLAYFANTSSIVCFDVRSERFSLINMDRDMLCERPLSLFNYKGNLGVYHHTTSWCKEVVLLCVLEDAGNYKWSKRICKLPSFVEAEIVRKSVFVGMTGTGELVFSPKADYLSNPFHVVYYNIERNTFTRFKILHGFEKFKDQRIVVHTSTDYVENMKFM